ncbi:FMN-binding negative transcriptional regulator [Cellvibrio fontiphilus]|uniref:FMN-binding negative transcriptional regulator n=1 Tax=Cellvibrio fontiphilus TaxID=1815559 RepID=A0ABV7F948_9GAMM
MENIPGRQLVRKNQMYCPRAFREERLDILHELIKAYPLATLITNGPNGLMANLIPFSLVHDGKNGILQAHVARNNSQLDSIREASEALVIFQGPQCYVTPSWYPSKAKDGKQVPTWNFVMVQARGKPTVIENTSWLLTQLNNLTSHLESSRDHPWRVSDAPENYIAAQLKGLVGIEIPISTIEGKWKVSQNRSEIDRKGVIAGLQAENACPAMSQLMNSNFNT